MLKRHKAMLLFLVVLLVLVSSGCWDALAIDDRDICTTVIVDLKNGIYSFYIEVIQPGGSPGEQGTSSKAKQTAVVKGSGPSLIEARNDLDNKLDKPLFLGAVQSLLITRSMAESGIEEYVYRVRDIKEYRKTLHVNVISKSPEEFLGITPEGANNVGFAIESTLDNERELGKITEVRLEDILQKLYSTNDTFILNELDANDGQVSVCGVSIFDHGKNIGSIPFEKCSGIAFISAYMSSKPKGNYVVPIENNQVTTEAACTKRDIKANYKDGKITFTLNMGFDGLKMYASDSSPITKQNDEEIKQKLEELIKKDLTDAVETSKVFKCDYLGFSEYFRAAYPDAFDKMDWHEEFPKAQFVFNVNVNVTTDKSLDYSVKRESK